MKMNLRRTDFITETQQNTSWFKDLAQKWEKVSEDSLLYLMQWQTCVCANSLFVGVSVLHNQIIIIKKNIWLNLNKRTAVMNMTLTWLPRTRLSCAKSDSPHPHQCKKQHHSLLEAHFQSFMILEIWSRQFELQMLLFLILNSCRE